MKNFRTQLEAIGSALLLIERLPAHTVWVLEVTNQDTAEEPTVLNIFADRDEWAMLQVSLRLGKPTDNDVMFRSFRQGTLYISFIEEEKDVRRDSE